MFLQLLKQGNRKQHSFTNTRWLDLYGKGFYNIINHSLKQKYFKRLNSKVSNRRSLICKGEILKILLYHLFLHIGSQRTVKNSSRDGNTRLPDLPLEKCVCRSRSNSENWTWNSRLVTHQERSTSRLYIVTLVI